VQVRLTRLQAELDGTLKDYAKLKEMVEKSGGSTHSPCCRILPLRRAVISCRSGMLVGARRRARAGEAARL
jgi:hypothetical protein